MNDAALAIAEHLDLDMSAVSHESLEVDARVAERRAGLGRGELHHVREVLESIDALHPAPAAAADRFHEHRSTDAMRERDRGVDGVDRTTRHDRHLCRLGLRAGAELVA